MASYTNTRFPTATTSWDPSGLNTRSHTVFFCPSRSGCAAHRLQAGEHGCHLTEPTQPGHHPYSHTTTTYCHEARSSTSRGTQTSRNVPRGPTTLRQHAWLRKLTWQVPTQPPQDEMATLGRGDGWCGATPTLNCQSPASLLLFSSAAVITGSVGVFKSRVAWKSKLHISGHAIITLQRHKDISFATSNRLHRPQLAARWNFYRLDTSLDDWHRCSE